MWQRRPELWLRRAEHGDALTQSGLRHLQLLQRILDLCLQTPHSGVLQLLLQHYYSSSEENPGFTDATWKYNH